MVMENSVNVNNFFVEVSNLKREGIFLDKDYIKKLNIKKECLENARILLGSDVERITDLESAKAFLRVLLSESDFRVFADALTMGLTYSLERLLIVHDRLSLRGDACTQQVMGVIYYLLGDILENEFKTLIKASNGGRLYPAYTMNTNSFKWSRCPFIFRKYMLRLSKPMGYDAYYYEKSNLGHLAFLTSDCVGMEVEDAEDYIKKMKKGIFMKDISSDLENKVIPDLLMGGYDTLDGLYASTVIKEGIKLESELGMNANISSVYSQHVKPLKIDFIGRVMAKITDEVKRNVALESGAFKIYNISTERFGILVKEGVDLKTVLPESYGLFKKVPANLTLRSFVTGEYL